MSTISGCYWKCAEQRRFLIQEYVIISPSNFKWCSSLYRSILWLCKNSPSEQKRVIQSSRRSPRVNISQRLIFSLSIHITAHLNQLVRVLVFLHASAQNVQYSWRQRHVSRTSQSIQLQLRRSLSNVHGEQCAQERTNCRDSVVVVQKRKHLYIAS